MADIENEIVTVPLVLHESFMERSRSILRTVVIGWTASVAALAVALACVLA